LSDRLLGSTEVGISWVTTTIRRGITVIWVTVIWITCVWRTAGHFLYNYKTAKRL
jgi:hypothetical protein